MANRPKEHEVKEAVDRYLAEARESSPSVHPISVNALSKALGFHRATVGKYVTEEDLSRTRQEQARFARSRVGKDKKEANEKLAKRGAEIAALRTRCEALLGQIARAEGNAQRLGLDPAELWKPLEAPPHTLPSRA